MSEDTSAALKEMTSEIVSAYVASNKFDASELPSLIQSVFRSLSGLDAPSAVEVSEDTKLTSAQIRKSIKPNGLVSFIDGKSYQTLKRHLSKNGFSVDDYKAKYGLPKDYPTTSAEYSAKRSEMARSLGLGRQKAVPEVMEAPVVKAPRKPRKAKVAA